MITLKSLCGELISLPVSSEEEFKKEYLLRYVKEKFRPFVTLHIEDGNLLVNLHSVLPQLEKMLYGDEEWCDSELSSAWKYLSRNPNAISILEKNLDMVNWHELCYNPNAIHILKENLDKLYWTNLSCNPKAEEIFRLYPRCVKWYSVAENHPDASSMIKELSPLPYSTHLANLCRNPHATPEWFDGHVKELSNICWAWLNGHPSMIPLLKRYPEKIIRGIVLGNIGALELIQQLAPFSKEELRVLFYNKSREVVDWVSTLPEYKICVEYWTKNTPNHSYKKLIRDFPKSPAAGVFYETLDTPENFGKFISRNPLAVHLMDKFELVDHIDRMPEAWYIVPKHIDRVLESIASREEWDVDIEENDNVAVLYQIQDIICPDSSDF